MSSRDSTEVPGRLFVVATPIGNLGDVSSRCIEVLNSVDAIAAEDTRRTRKLLSHFSIRTPLVSYHDHNEERAAASILSRLDGGSDVALVSDAGTPLVSDPGYRLVSACAERGVEVVPVPGPSALTAALSVSALPPHPFHFAGYLPRKTGARRKRLEVLGELGCTLIFYESPHRVAATLRDMRDVLGSRRAVIARELTKAHEEILRGTLTELAELAGKRALRGEIVLLVDGGGGASDPDPGGTPALGPGERGSA
jgi:16S rRNA (cytidine1402-2'-O)-methyltransferase